VLVAAAVVDDEARKVASVLDGVVVVDGFVVPALSELADFVAKGLPVAVLGELSLLDLSTIVSTHSNNTSQYFTYTVPDTTASAIPGPEFGPHFSSNRDAVINCSASGQISLK
jgi:hypothetical protein